MNTALHQILSIDTVDSTEYIPISQLNPPPVITFCPRQGYDEDKLFELGYFDSSDLMTGIETKD